MSDKEVDRFQVKENENRIETRPVDNVRRLQKIINTGRMTVEELAHDLGRHVDWVNRLLSLNHLSPNCKKALDKGEISCKLSIQLALLPLQWQDRLLSLNGDYPSHEYLEILRAEVREFRGGKKAIRGGRKRGIQPAFRSFREVKHEYLEPTEKATILTRRGATTGSQGWDACIQWVLSDDPETVAMRQQRKDYNDRLKLERERQLNELHLNEPKS